MDKILDTRSLVTATPSEKTQLRIPKPYAAEPHTDIFAATRRRRRQMYICNLNRRRSAIWRMYI